MKPKLPTRRESLLALALVLAMYGAAKVLIRHDAHAVWILVIAGAIVGATLLFGRFNGRLRKRSAEPDKRSQLKL